MKQWSVGALVLLSVVVCGAAVAGFGSRAPAQEVARESLDLLKSMAHRSSVAHVYIGACVTAIAHAKRFEARKDALGSSIKTTWAEAAGRCRVLASNICEQPAMQPPKEACSRIRGFEPLT